MRALIYDYIQDLYRNSEYIPTVTTFMSILANCFYFNTSMALRTKFVRSTHQVLPKKLWTNHQKITLFVVGYEEFYSKFYVASTFRALPEDCHRLDLDTCVRKLVTKNGEFERPQ